MFTMIFQIIGYIKNMFIYFSQYGCNDYTAVDDTKEIK